MGVRMTDFVWADDSVTLLASLWADGLSASQIAAELGGGVSRNAVIGKLHRIGLTGANGGSKPHKAHLAPATVPQARPYRRRQPVSTPDGALPAEPLPLVSLDDLAIPVEQRRTLHQLTDMTCRWPVGDIGSPSFFFCGGPADNIKTGPYCAFHSRVAGGGYPRGIRRNNYRTFR